MSVQKPDPQLSLELVDDEASERDHEDALIDEGLEESFPASDPVAPSLFS